MVPHLRQRAAYPPSVGSITMGATWPHRSGATGVKEILVRPYSARYLCSTPAWLSSAAQGRRQRAPSSQPTPCRSTSIATTASMCFKVHLDPGGLMEMRLITQEWGPRGGEARGRIAQEAGSTPSVAFRTVIRRDESRAGRSALGAVVRRRYVALTIFGYSSPKSIWQSSPIHRGRLR